MTQAAVLYKPIGVIRSSHITPQQTPIQPGYAKGSTGWVEIFPEFSEGLRDLEGFSHLYFKAKCPVMARRVSLPVGTNVLMQSANTRLGMR